MKKSMIRPLGNRIVIKRAESLQRKGGILLPDSAQKKPLEGEVLAVGPGKLTEEGKMIPVEVRVGERVLFSSYAGTEYQVDDEELLIVSEDDILAVF